MYRSITFPQVSRIFRLPDFKIFGTLRWYIFQSYTPASFTIPGEIYV